MRCSIKFKEGHQVGKLAMNVTKDLQWGFWGKDHGLVDDYFLSHVTQVVDMFGFKVNVDRLGVHETFGLEKFVEEVMWDVGF